VDIGSRILTGVCGNLMLIGIAILGLPVINGSETESSVTVDKISVMLSDDAIIGFSEEAVDE
jgi:hypothetical protein